MISYSFCGSGVQEWLSWEVWAQGFQRWQSKHQPGLQPPEGLTGAEGCTSKMAHLDGCWLLAETSVSHHVDFSRGLLKCPNDMAATSPQQVSQRSKGRNGSVLLPSLRFHTLLFPQCPIDYMVQCSSLGKPLPQGMGTRKHGSLGACLQAGWWDGILSMSSFVVLLDHPLRSQLRGLNIMYLIRKE